MITNIKGTKPARFMLDGLYAWEENIPKGLNARAHLEANIDRLRLQTRKKEYPQAPGRNKMDLVEFDAWIQAGALDDQGDPVAKKAQPGTHQAGRTLADMLPNQADLFAQLEQATTAPAISRVVKEILLSELAR